MNYIKFSVYNFVNKHFSVNRKIIKLTYSKKKQLSKKVVTSYSNFNYKQLKNKKKFRKKVLEIIGAHIINLIWKNYKINKKEVRALWK